MASKRAIERAGPKKKGGKKSKLTAETAETALTLAAKGAWDKDIAHVIGIHPQTFTEWKGSYAEFAEALKEAREKPIEAVEAALYRVAMGYTHVEEKIFVNKNGKVTRVPVLKHYAPNPSALALYLRAQKPSVYRQTLDVKNLNPVVPADPNKVKTFSEFAVAAGYPAPFPVQEEMRAFGMDESEARLLLGSRGYGKTDYVVILGIAYEIYLDFMAATREKRPPIESNLLVTKSEERNAAMLDEIRKACELNGVTFEKQNASSLRVTGLHGKDHTVSSITIGASSIRGRHPRRVVMDDPVTEEDHSEATRKRVQRVYNELNKLCKNVLVIGQPVHKFDLYETIRPLVLKMEVPHGSIPELDHDLEAQRLAGVSEESIQASYFLKVISEAGYPLEKVQFIDAWEPGDCVAFIDPSFEGGDYTALSIVKAHFQGVAVQGHVYKRAWYDCLDDMAKAMEAAGVRKVCFETNSLGDQPVTMLRDVLPQSVGVVGKRSTGHKHSRILQAGAFAHQIFIAKTSDKLYIDQVTKYEYGADNDDAPDSLASALEWIGLIRGKVKA